MSMPISPNPVTSLSEDYLPAYLSNGVLGLRVREIPLLAGVASMSGLSGIDPVSRITSSPYAPYPLAGDISLGQVSLSLSPHLLRFVSQTYDFSCGELTSRFEFPVDGTIADVEVLTFCSRTLPMLVVQEVALTVNEAADVTMTGLVDPRGIAGDWGVRWTQVPGEKTDLVDGTLSWIPFGGLSTCGVSYSTEFLGDDSADRSTVEEAEAPLGTSWAFRARANQRYRLRQIAAMVPSSLHSQPEAQAIRLVAEGRTCGFDMLREENRAAWAGLWESRIILHGADKRWQALADAAFYYLQSSAHPASASSVHIFGLARWPNYHYYHGHVMWDVEAFVLPPLLLIQPEAAWALLNYRHAMIEAARVNARMRGDPGILYPWESDPERGEEATLGAATGTIYEEHVNFTIALGVARYAHATGDKWFLHDRAWPILRGVAEWTAGRVVRTERGYEIQQTMGIAERKAPESNVAYVNMAAAQSLREAYAAGTRLGMGPPKEWLEIADGLVIPMDSAGRIMVDHDGYRRNEEKGATPGALAGIFPIGYPLKPAIEQATLRYFLEMADEYIGSPMLPALYGTWAARTGDRDLALKLLEDGYGAYVSERFMNTHEYRQDRFPEQPVAGPFHANMGAFLITLLYGLPGLRITDGDVPTWAERPVVLPRGWDAIEVKRLRARGGAAHLLARHGDERATLTLL